MDQSSEGLYKTWMADITDALKREKTFRKQGRDCVELYEGKKYLTEPFAILYSNTETLIPAVYNSTPIPIVERKFKDADPLGKAAAEVGTRSLKFLITAESKDYDNFDELMSPAVLDALVTNRGLTRFKYVATRQEGRIKDECVYGEAVRWDKFFHGYARTWKKVPWIGFEWDMSEDEVKKNFPDIADKISFSNLDMSTEEDTEGSGESREELTGVKLAKVYEIWDKRKKKVYFISPCYPEGYLKEVDDPLELDGFFPVPKPLNFMKKVSTLVPTPLYIQYMQQATELNDITRRLKAIIKALKVRGFYDSTIEGIDKLLTAGDNEMIPVENRASMPEGMGMDKMLWLMPLSELSTTAQNLYQQREQVKQVIYEITGISDILRGASVASETATAQNIKNQWGTLRLKKMQKEVMRYCRDCLRITLEIAATKFSVKTFAAMTGLSFPRQEEKQQAQRQIAMLQAQANVALMMAPQQPMDPMAGGQPTQPQPPQIPPQLQQIVSTPSWEEIIAVLENDLLRAYKVDIETNSTIDAEASQDKQDISDLLNAMGQFLNGVGPLIQEGAMPFDVAKTMMLAIARRFTFGSQIEDQLNAMQAPQKGPDPTEQAKTQQLQIQNQMEEAKNKREMDKMALEAQNDQMRADQERQLMLLEFDIKREEFNLKRQELGLKATATNLKNQQMMETHEIKMKQMKETAAAKPKEPANASV